MAYSIAHGRTGVESLDRQGSNYSIPTNGIENGGGSRHSPFPEGAGAPIYPTREEAPLNGGRGSYASMPLDAGGHSGGMHESRRRAHPGMGGHVGHLQHGGGGAETPDRRQMHQQMQASRVTANPHGRPKSTQFDL